MSKFNFKISDFFNKESYGIYFITFLFLLALITGSIDSTEMVIIYVLETIIIGFYHIIKMLIASYAQNKFLKGFGLALFFTVHYGFFVFIQTTFFFVFLSINDDRITDSFGLSNFETVLQFKGVQMALVFLFITYFIKLINNFILNDKYKEVDVDFYMFQPYLRIIIQQFAAIVPGFFIIFGQAGIAVGVILVLLRAFTDLVILNIKNSEILMSKIVNYLSKNQKEGKTASKEEIEKFVQMIVEE